MSDRSPDLKIIGGSTEDIELARAYWSQTEQGGWKHSVAKLTTMFNRHSDINKVVKQVCTASHPAILCQSCGERAESSTRTEYENRWDYLDQAPKLGRRQGVLWCRACVVDFLERQTDPPSTPSLSPSPVAGTSG